MKSPQFVLDDRYYQKTILEIRAQPYKTPSPRLPDLRLAAEVARNLPILPAFSGLSVGAGLAPTRCGSFGPAFCASIGRHLDRASALYKIFWK
jgi:hypothetical protein